MNPSREIDDLETVTQFGTRDGGFRNWPRAMEEDVSVLIGRLTVEQSARLVRRRGGVARGDGVRYARAGALRHAGFAVRHTPTRSIVVHASVESSGVWDDEARMRFDRVFSEPIFHE